MMRYMVLMMVASLAVAGCAYESGQGESVVGSGDYEDGLRDQAAREAVQRIPEKTTVGHTGHTGGI